MVRGTGGSWAGRGGGGMGEGSDNFEEAIDVGEVQVRAVACDGVCVFYNHFFYNLFLQFVLQLGMYIPNYTHAD